MKRLNLLLTLSSLNLLLITAERFSFTTRFPFSIYTAMAYTAGTILALAIRIVQPSL